MIIGVLGGMGTYATIHLFEQYAALFSAKKEWERPRIIIDNRCTMPSRVRALLYDENVEKLVDEMSESLCNLAASGCDRIILDCNTSHLFLPVIFKTYPELETKVVNIVNMCVSKIAETGTKRIFLLASEGTIDSKIYQNKFAEYDIECIVPSEDEYILLRRCIEAVKQNQYDNETKQIFLDLVNRFNICLLGCTEMPILYEKYKDFVRCEAVFDPVYIALTKLKEEFYDD